MGADIVGSDPVGSDTVGSDPYGSDTVGSDTVGSDPYGSDTVGSDPCGNGGCYGGGYGGYGSYGGYYGGEAPARRWVQWRAGAVVGAGGSLAWAARRACARPAGALQHSPVPPPPPGTPARIGLWGRRRPAVRAVKHARAAPPLVLTLLLPPPHLARPQAPAGH